jgi:hypothetical protein
VISQIRFKKPLIQSENQKTLTISRATSARTFDARPVVTASRLGERIVWLKPAK